MITAELSYNAVQRINASEVHQAESLLEAVKENLKPEGFGTYFNLQEQYWSLARDRRGSAQALGAEIRRKHAEIFYWTLENERSAFFLKALGTEYDSFRVSIFRKMGLVNESHSNGNTIKAAPTFDYIENKAIEEEHRKEQIASRQPATRQVLPVLALIRGPGHTSSDGKFCRIEIDQAPYGIGFGFDDKASVPYWFYISQQCLWCPHLTGKVYRR